MFNKNNERELAYVAKIEEIKSLDGYDKVEYARVGAGWWVIVLKDQFKVGDKAIYFEVDSRVPEREPFMFLQKRNFKIKTIRMCKVISQGLLMSFEDFNWDPNEFEVGDFLTKKLGITYSLDSDNQRKANSFDKYTKMKNRHQKLFKKKFFRWLYNKNWGRKLLYFVLPKPKKKNEWPVWVKKTDEERCQNMPWLFNNDTFKNEYWIATEKIDGTSTTFTVKGFGRKRQFKVCSRNVVFDSPDKACFYDENVYQKVAQKYNAEEVMSAVLDKYKDDNWEFLTVQGETFGQGIQKRDYGTDLDFRVFNIIIGYKNGMVIRLNPLRGEEFSMMYLKMPYVPIIKSTFTLPETCEELLQMAEGNSVLDDKEREGLVFRSYDGSESFKAVSNSYLLKYHG